MNHPDYRAHLQQIAEMFRGQYEPHGRISRYELVATRGRVATARQGYPIMEMKRCYNNSIEMALTHGYDYMEGYAFRADIGIPIDHAWNYDPTGSEHVDYTLRGAETCYYIGLTVPHDVLVKVCTRREMTMGEGILGAINFLGPRLRKLYFGKIEAVNPLVEMT